MGQAQSGGAGGPPGEEKDKKAPPKRFEPPPPPTRVGKKQRRKAADSASRLPSITPTSKCKLRLLKLERVRDYLLLEEEYVSNQEARKPLEARNEAERTKVDEMRGNPMSVGSLEEMIDDKCAARCARPPPALPAHASRTSHAIVSSTNGPEYYVSIMSFVDKSQARRARGGARRPPPPHAPAPAAGARLLRAHAQQVALRGGHPVGRGGPAGVGDEGAALSNPPRAALAGPLRWGAHARAQVEKAPTESYADIGGLEDQIQEIKESVELPLTHPELYEDIGIKPPKGVILYGEPGTGKTLLAKAVANSTSATFLRVVGSELIQKYLGDGPKLVRELFRVADELAPSIVFIDEIDAVGTKRYDSTSGGEREIQRTMLELLNQMDGFDARSDVKVIMATNRIETLDPALLRPGRIDRKIEFPLPDAKTKRRIFTIHTSRMSLADDVVLEEFVMSKNELSGADIKAMCTEAGLLALRERRMRITHADFKKALDKLMYRKKDGAMEGLYL